MDKAMAADLDRHLTTEPSGPVEYQLEEVPVIRALALMGNSPASPDDWGMNDLPTDAARREFIYKYYQSSSMPMSLFSVGWERGVERQQLRLPEATEIDETEELDPDEASWHYLFGYMAGQVATYEGWATPYTKDHEDDFIDEMSEEGGDD